MKIPPLINLSHFKGIRRKRLSPIITARRVLIPKAKIALKNTRKGDFREAAKLRMES